MDIFFVNYVDDSGYEIREEMGRRCILPIEINAHCRLVKISNKPVLHRVFAEIKSEEEAIAFANQYGLLGTGWALLGGLDIDDSGNFSHDGSMVPGPVKARVPIITEEEYNTIEQVTPYANSTVHNKLEKVRYWKRHNGRFFPEPVSLWLHHSKVMRKNVMNWDPDCYGYHSQFEEPSLYKGHYYEINLALMEGFSCQLAPITVQTGNANEYLSHMSFHANNLYTALWYLFAKEVGGIRRVKRCQGCKKLFIVGGISGRRPNAHYHSEDCRIKHNNKHRPTTRKGRNIKAPNKSGTS